MQLMIISDDTKIRLLVILRPTRGKAPAVIITVNSKRNRLIEELEHIAQAFTFDFW